MVQVDGVELESADQKWPLACYRCPARTNMQSLDFDKRKCRPEIFGGESRNRNGRYVRRPADCPNPAIASDKASETPEMILKRQLRQR